MTSIRDLLPYLPDQRILDLERITETILATKAVEFVVLFGSYARGDYKETRGRTQGKRSDYDILVVTADAEARRGLRKKLRNRFRHMEIPVQLLVEKIGFVNSNLEEKQFFFTDIKREGKVLYSSGDFELSDPQELSPTRRREIAEKDFESWFGTATKVMNEMRKDLRLAAFDLQQVVELCYTSIEMVYTHYRPYEHNLEVLRNRVMQYDRRVTQALPWDTEAHQELFDHLNLAYIGGRYRSEEEYSVTTAQLEYWHAEAQKLLLLTKEICQDHIDRLIRIETER